jgi:TolA-binding protein
VTVATTPPPAPIVPAPEPIVRRAPTVRPPKRVVVPPPAPVVIKQEPAARPPIELAYEDAWDAMRHGSFSRAALQFARVLALEPDGSLAEDAAFWRPVALARAKQRALAITAFRDLLDGRHVKSPHAGEASAMLGWLLIDDRKFDEATLRFRAAIDDASPAVRKSARAGLDAIARH